MEIRQWDGQKRRPRAPDQSKSSRQSGGFGQGCAREEGRTDLWRRSCSRHDHLQADDIDKSE